MSQIHHTFNPGPLLTQQMTGNVTHCFDDGSIMVESDGRGWHCRRAVSCVITPMAGDTVLLTPVEPNMWILAVLEQADATQSELSTPGHLRIQSEGELSLRSETLHISANAGECHIKEMTYSGEKLNAWVSLSQMVGKRLESVWQTVMVVSHNFFRTTHQTELVRAGQLDMKAERYARLHADNTLITSKTITKIDSEQIHMG